MSKQGYKRILLKISGEVLMGAQSFGIDLETVGRVADEVIDLSKAGAEVALVIGGGNIFRGLAGAAKGMDRVSADHMGIMATLMNGLAMEGVLQRKGADARMMSAIAMPSVCEPFNAEIGRRHLSQGRIVICSGGTGLPFFTTDTGAALRAAELKCEAIFKGTSVDGVYSADPKKVPNAKRFDKISFNDVLAKDLRILDAAAIALARDNDIPVVVFSIREPGNVAKVLGGKGLFTTISKD